MALPTRPTRPAPVPGPETAAPAPPGNWLMLAVLLLGQCGRLAAAMSGTACWLAALSFAGLVAAAVMVRAARGQRP